MTQYDYPMRRTIYLPDELGARIAHYLNDHPETSLSALVQEALTQRLAPRDPRALLDLAGFVRTQSSSARERAEDMTIARER